MARRAPSLSSQLSRRSRRALAAFLLLGGSALTVIAGPASAHDHAIDRPDESEAVAESLLRQPADLAGLPDDWMFEDCWSYRDCSAATCAESSSPTQPMIAMRNGPSGHVDRKSSKLPPSSAGIGKQKVAKGDAAETVARYLRIEELIAWGSGAKQWISPLLAVNPFMPLANEPTAGEQRFSQDLSDLTCEEPVDIQAGTRRSRSYRTVDVATNATSATSGSPAASEPRSLADGSIASTDSLAAEPPKFERAALLGSSAIIATLTESYLPYDLSPEDAIAMRMYPIAYPQSNYLGARRTGAYAPVDGLAGGVQWREVTEPAVTVRTGEVVTVPRSDEQKEADRWLADLANRAIEAVHPGSDAREWLRPQRVAGELGEWVHSGNRAADSALRSAAISLAALWQPAPRRRGEKLVAEAIPQTLQLSAPEAATPDQLTDRACVLRLELACQTAIDMVLAQAARSHQPAMDLTPPATEAVAATGPQNEVARAEAVATACDRAAASLEKLAMALRRAGDSLIRQAKTGSDSSSLLR